jgi:hypothetical protein
MPRLLSASMRSPYLTGLHTSLAHFFISSVIAFVLLASSTASHGHHVAWNRNPISFLSTCSPSFSFSWSTSAPVHPPVLIVNASSICMWHCSPPAPSPSLGMLFSIVATVTCPSPHMRECKVRRLCKAARSPLHPRPMPAPFLPCHSPHSPAARSVYH